MRILYVQRGLAPPPKDARLEHFHYLSASLGGDILLPVWWNSPEEAIQELGPGNYPVCEAGAFRYHLFLAGYKDRLVDKWAAFRFYVRKGRELFRQEPYQCIVTYGYSLTAFSGIVLKLLTGAKLVLEINSEPGKAYLFNRSKPAVIRKATELASLAMLHVAACFTDCFRLLYPEQLDRFPLLRKKAVSVFHAFVPTSLVKPTPAKNNRIVFAGYPWYLKGVDVLIQAFREVAPDFPEARLMLYGHFPDRAELEKMAAGCDRIEIGKPLPYQQMLAAIEAAQVVAHPTRTEGMGRVLVEAMAARTPCVASNVGGIPFYLHDGETGLLARTGDSQDLAAKLRLLLADPELRDRIAENALTYAREHLTEEVYTRSFVKMVTLAVGEAVR